MNDEILDDSVARLMRLIADRLERHLDGDEQALETLGESIEQEGLSPDDVQTVVLVLQSLARGAGVESPMSDALAPGEGAHRVPSREERESLSPEAWGYLIDLRRRGSLTAGQLERVLDRLTGCGVRPVSVDLARDVATRVALQGEDMAESEALEHGDFDLAH